MYFVIKNPSALLKSFTVKSVIAACMPPLLCMPPAMHTPPATHAPTTHAALPTTHTAFPAMHNPSIGSSGRVGGAKKHEIYVATFGGHLFYDLFVQGWGGHGPLSTPLDPLLNLLPHTPLPCTPPPSCHAPLLPHTPLPCMPPPLWTEFLTHTCENITLP